jgi:hypothetical protein
MRKITNNFSRESRWPDRESNRVLHEYKSKGLLLDKFVRSVWKNFKYVWPYEVRKLCYRRMSNTSCGCSFFFCIVGGGVQTGSTRHVGHLLAYCICPGWLWGWRNWWNEWQGKPKYSEKTCPDATLSITNPLDQTRDWTRVTAVGSQRLTASAMARPWMFISPCIDYTIFWLVVITDQKVIQMKQKFNLTHLVAVLPFTKRS